MADTVLEPEGSIEIVTSKDGIEAQVTLFFVFGGDWTNMYQDEPDDEAMARQWFVREVQQALEARRVETRNSSETGRPSRTED